MLIVLLAIPDDLGGHVLAPRAFKGASVVTSFLRLDANEPHIGVAEFTRRMRDHPQFRKYLIRSHVTPLIGFNFKNLGGHLHLKKIQARQFF
jgi:hypothetical protein